ncbi:putative Glutathione s-transferase [Quillaja saponaria]|uniref:glutathione transferase n=1 Tax=Quillaja saponaria TaxID=32244 RepID=A0AAD7Q5H8_QUISA|nr:putative Glutathione s-transferase [Quillaja saponaria]
MGEVKLIASTESLFCVRIEWALKLKGVEYKYIEEDLRSKSKTVILEYIDETWKENPLLPQDPYQRALARCWAKFVDEKCVFGAWGACIAKGEEKEKAVESALESLAFLEKQIQGKKFFGGEQIGLLDLVAGWIPHWLNVMEEVGGMKLLDAEQFPSLHEWAQNFIHTSLVKECLPPREKLVNYFNASVSYMHSLAANK